MLFKYKPGVFNRLGSKIEGEGSRSGRLIFNACMAAGVGSTLPVLLPPRAAASTVYYWDGGGPANGNGPQDGSGTWNDVNLKWLAGSPTASDTNWTDGNEANFSNNSTGSSAYTVTLGSNITASQIDLNNPGTGASYSFNLNGFTLTTLSSASGDGVNVGAGSNTTFTNGTLIDAPNSQTSGHPGFSMRGGSITLGQGAVVQTDYISSNTPTAGYANAMYFNGATLQPVWGNDEPVLYATTGGSTSSAFTGAFIGAGGLTVDTSHIESGDTTNSDIYLSLSHLTSLGGTADGGLTKTGSGSLYLDATSSYTGPTTVNAGTLVLNAYQTETSSNYVVNSGAVLNAGASNAVVGSSGGNTVTINGGTLTTTDGVTAHLANVFLNGGTITSGAPNSGYGSWALNGGDSITVSANSTLSALDMYFASGSALNVAAGATLSVTGTFSDYSVIGIKGAGLTVLSGDNPSLPNTAVTVNNGATLQLQANAGNTTNSISYALGGLPSGGLTLSNGQGTGTLQLRSDASVAFAGTTSIGGAYLATYDFDVNNTTGTGGSGAQGNTISIGSFATYGTTINVTGGNGYTLAVGATTNGYGQSMAVNAVSANVTFGSIGVSGSGVSSLTLNASGGTIAVAGTIVNTGATTIKGASNVTLAGNVQGTNLIMNGTGVLTLEGSSTYTGVTQVNSGTLMIEPNFGSGIQTLALPGGLNIAGGAVTQVATVGSHSNRALIQVGKLSIAGSANAWTGTLDLGNNDLDLTGASLATVTNQVAQGYNKGQWNGGGNGSGGIVSSAAAADSSHLTALGVISNNVSGSALYSSYTGSMGLFDGTAPGLNDVLVKYTYYGDTDLSGSVDGTDYSRIDNGFLNHLTGWFNGDFNYDGVVNGSDYTLIDNAFNSQGASLAASVAGPSALPTAQLAGSLGAASGTSAVPEPASIGILTLLSLGLLGRRRRV
jgi:autotransporter-associated beta strand protein